MSELEKILREIERVRKERDHLRDSWSSLYGQVIYWRRKGGKKARERISQIRKEMKEVRKEYERARKEFWELVDKWNMLRNVEKAQT